MITIQVDVKDDNNLESHGSRALFHMQGWTAFLHMLVGGDFLGFAPLFFVYLAKCVGKGNEQFNWI